MAGLGGGLVARHDGIYFVSTKAYVEVIAPPQWLKVVIARRLLELLVADQHED